MGLSRILLPFYSTYTDPIWVQVSMEVLPAIDARNVHAIESDYTDAELATFVPGYSSAENILSRASVGKDDIVLVPGASGGVGCRISSSSIGEEGRCQSRCHGFGCKA